MKTAVNVWYKIEIFIDLLVNKIKTAFILLEIIAPAIMAFKVKTIFSTSIKVDVNFR